MADNELPNEKQKGQRNEMRMIARAASILRALGEEPLGLSLGQLAKETGLARSTVQRLVGAMEIERLVSTEAGRAGVRLGPEIPRLANAAHGDIKTLIRPAIEALHRAVEDTVDVSLWQSGGAVVIDQAFRSGGILRVVSHVGTVLPTHCSSNGKVHMALMPDEQLEEVLSQPLVRRTANTIVDRDALRAQIAEIRAGGFAVDNEEHTEGVSAISLPILGLSHDNYAFGVLIPTPRYQDRQDMLQKALRECQNSIKAILGH